MNRISAVIVTYNEEKKIRPCLETLRWADEVVVMDLGSSDATMAIAREFTPAVHSHAWSKYVEPVRNDAIGLASGDWILVLDPDEHVSPALAQALRDFAANPGDNAALRLPRRNRLLGAWLNHGLLWPDYQVRFFKRGAASWDGRVHQQPVIRGSIASLPARPQLAILHYCREDLGSIARDIDRCTTIEADEWQAAGIRPSLWKMIVYPPGLFLYAYVWRRGALDGRRGLIHAALMAHYTFLKRAKLWELSIQSRPSS